MTKYIIKRILLSVVILFFVSLILYFLIRCMPVSYIENKFNEANANGANLTEEDLKRLLAIYGHSFALLIVERLATVQHSD